MTATMVDVGDYGVPGEYAAHRFEVTVTDQFGEGVFDATAVVYLEKSDGTTSTASGATNFEGIVFFEPRVTVPGTNFISLVRIEDEDCEPEPTWAQVSIWWEAF